MKTENTERRYFNINLRAAQADGVDKDAPKRTVYGHAATFNTYSENLGWFREIIMPGAFRNALANSDIRALFNHDPNHLLARTASNTLTVLEDETGLYFEYELPSSRNDILEAIERGDLNQNSFAFTIEREEWHYDDDNKIDIRKILEVKELYDVSLVTYPAYPNTDVALRSFNATKPSTELIFDKEKIENSDKKTISIYEAKLQLIKNTM